MNHFSQSNPNLQAEALAYARQGWRVLPLDGKLPRTAHGCTDATTDQAAIVQWWTHWPTANIGIATGAKSGLFVVDFDGECDLPAVLQNLPRTVTARTSRGPHAYFRYPVGHKIGNRTKINGLPIDLRGEGGYVVAPPSLHPNGARYEWLVEPSDCEPAAPPWD